MNQRNQKATLKETYFPNGNKKGANDDDLPPFYEASASTVNSAKPIIIACALATLIVLGGGLYYAGGHDSSAETIAAATTSSGASVKALDSENAFKKTSMDSSGASQGAGYATTINPSAATPHEESSGSNTLNFIDRESASISVEQAKAGIEALFNEISKKADVAEKKNYELTALLAKQKIDSQRDAEALRVDALRSAEVIRTEAQRNESVLKNALQIKDGEIATLNASLSSFEEKRSRMEQENTGLSDENDALRRENGHLNIQLSDLRHNAKLQKHSLSIEGPVVEEAESPAKKASLEPAPSIDRSPPKPEKTSLKASRTADSRTSDKKPGLSGFSVVGATSETIIGMKDGKSVTINVGDKWNGIQFLSVDTKNGVIKTSNGDIQIKQ